MMTRDSDDKRTQIVYLCIDDLVPEDHLLRLVDKALDWTFMQRYLQYESLSNKNRTSEEKQKTILRYSVK